MINYRVNLKTFRCLDLSRTYNLQNNFQYKKVKPKYKLIDTENKLVVARETGGGGIGGGAAEK